MIKKIIPGILLALVLSTFPVAPVGGESELVLRVETDKGSYKPGETMRITVFLRNFSSSVCKITFNTSQTFDFKIEDEKGRTVYLWSKDKFFLQVITQIILKPYEEIVLGEERVTLNFPQGLYSIVPVLPSTNISPSMSVSVITIHFGIGLSPALASLFLWLRMDRTVYFYGEPVWITIGVTNSGGSTAFLEFPSSQVADCQIFRLVDDKPAELLYHWAKGRAFLEVITSVELKHKEPKELLSFKWVDSRPAPADGKPYRLLIKGWAPAMNYKLEGSRTITFIPPAGGVGDIKGHWAEWYVRECLAAGLLSLYFDNSFKPDKTISRGEFFGSLAIAMKLTPSTSKVSPFNDLPVTHPHFAHIKKLVEKGVVKGYPDRSLRPDERITRSQVATLLAQAFSLKRTIAMPFVDVPSEHWAYNQIALVFYEKLMVGYSLTRFGPEDILTRAQAAPILLTVKNRTEKQ